MGRLVASLALAGLRTRRRRHRRRGLAALVDATRRELLNMLAAPADPLSWDPDRPPTARQLRHREWHAIACAIGDLIEDLASWFFVALTVVCAGGLIAAVLVWIGSWWVYSGFTAGIAVGLVVWLVHRRQLRRLAESVTEVMSIVDERGAI